MAGAAGLRILPRMKTDLEITHRISTASTAPTAVIAPVSRSTVQWYWVAVAIGLGFVGVWKFVRRKVSGSS